MSLFIGGLAFAGSAELSDAVKIGVLGGSIISGVAPVGPRSGCCPKQKCLKPRSEAAYGFAISTTSLPRAVWASIAQ
jgi:hypothetical protein